MSHGIAILRMNASYMHAMSYSSKLRLVKGLYQKYTATLGCHSRWCSGHNWFVNQNLP